MEHQCRAKRLDNNENIYGYYAEIQDKGYMFNYDSEFERVCDSTEQCFNAIVGFVEVNKETVNRCSGFMDCNCHMLYEDDIVKFNDWRSLFVVCYDYGTFGLGIRTSIDYKDLKEVILNELDKEADFLENDNFISLWEIYQNFDFQSHEIDNIHLMGNKHDNPNLIK